MKKQEGGTEGGIRGNPYRGGLSIEGGHCFPLMIYEFSSNNAIYSESLSFTIFVFLLTPFDT